MISNIIHISDLHVRSGDTFKSRYDEYLSVFNRLCDDLTTFQPIIQNKTIIVIAGDIFHDKLKIESCGLHLVNHLLQRLSSLAPVIIIRGNHDYRQEYPNEPDLIQSLLVNPIKNVTYYNKTGHYIFENIGFGLVSIQDALLSGSSSGITDKLPNFPDPSYFQDKGVDYTISLFHGTVTNTKLENGFESSKHSTYPKEWFKGYDAVILGDIHLQQVHGAKIITHDVNATTSFKYSTLVNAYEWTMQPMAYSGSLIQQNIGEYLLPHGFLIWDLASKQIFGYHVCNDYAIINVKKNYDNNTLLIRHQRKWIPLDDIINMEWFPSKLQVRVSSKDTNDVLVFDEIRSKFAEVNKSALNTVYQIINSDEVVDENIIDYYEPASLDITSFNSPPSWVDFIKNTTVPSYTSWENWFHNLQSLQVPPSLTKINNSKLIHDFTKRNSSLDEIITKFIKARDHEQIVLKKNAFHINHLEWENILCFKGHNFFDFDSSAKNVLSIIAQNGWGKTSFLETICIALYGQDFPSRSNSSYSSSIIHKNKMDDELAQTTIYFTIQNEKYKINRKFNYQSNINFIKSTSQDISLHKFDTTSNAYDVLHYSTTVVKTWIHDNIGTYDAFLTSCMISQHCDRDFFNNSSVEQRNLLDNSLHINSTSEFQAIIKESKLAHHAILENAKVMISSLGVSSCIQDPSILQKDLNEKQVMLQDLEAQKQNILDSYHNVNILTQKIPDFQTIFKYGKDNISYRIEELKNVLSTIDPIMESVDTDDTLDQITDIHKELAVLQSSITTSVLESYTSQKLVQKDILQLKNNFECLPKPTMPLKEITEKEQSYQQFIMKFNIEFPNLVIGDLRDIIVSLQNDIKDKNTVLESSKQNLQELNKQLEDNKTSLIKHREARPLDPRSTLNEYEQWLQDLSYFKDKYNDISKLQNLFDTCTNESLVRPSIDFDVVSSKYIDVGDIDINKITQERDLLQNNLIVLKSDLEDQKSLHTSTLKQHPPPPHKSIKDYDSWCKDSSLFSSKYPSGYEKLVNDLKDMEISKPEVPHTSLSYIQDNLKKFKKQVKLYNNSSIETIKLSVSNTKLLISELEKEYTQINQQYIQSLSDKPTKPIRYNDIESYNHNFDKFLEIKLSILINPSLSMDIDKVTSDLQALDKVLPVLDSLSSQYEEYKNMLASIEDHPYNPDCWACKQQPWKIQQNNILDKYRTIENAMQELKTTITNITGDVDAQSYLVKLKEHHNALIKYNTSAKEELDFWIPEKQRILDFSAWQVYSMDLEKKSKQLSSRLIQNKKELTSGQKELDILETFEQLQTDLAKWNTFNKWSEQYTKIYEDSKKWRKLIDQETFWKEDLLRKEQYDKWTSQVEQLEAQTKSNMLKIKEIENEVIHLQDIQDKYQTGIIYQQWIDYNNWQTRLSLLTTDLNKFKLLLDQQTYWKEEHERINAIKIWNEQLNILEQNDQQLSFKINAMNTNITKLQDEIDTYQRKINSLETYVVEFDIWKPVIESIEKDKSIHNQHENTTKQLEQLQKIKQIFELKESLQELQDDISDHKTLVESKATITIYQSVLNLWDQWKSALDDYKSLSAKQNIIDSLRKEETILQQKIDLATNVFQQNNTLQEYINELSERYEALCSIHESFGQFKKWIYENKVMPYLCNSLNNIVNQISISRPLYVTCNVTTDTYGAIQFSWFMKDGRNTLPISKCSGFQRSMIGFAMRISLAQLGATSIKSYQLFIDEGFTACDAENRSRVGDLLQDLGHKYKQIIIVSHLEDINACAHEHIHISRSTDYSSLHYGQPMQHFKIKRNRKSKLSGVHKLVDQPCQEAKDVSKKKTVRSLSIKK